ncbi:MAG: nuclear transport factor 2 family protein [Pseudomonadales bacterium]
MSSTIEIAEQYFELSSRSDMEAIEAMFTESSTYSSVNTGVYLGRSQIMTMMRAFHSAFESLTWTINSIEEIRPNVVHIEFSLKSVNNYGQVKESNGNEYVLTFDDKLQHVEVRR